MRALLSLALLAATTVASAADFAALKPRGYVNDFAGVLDAGAIEELNRYCARVEASTGAQFAFVTLASLEGEPIEDVANALYRKWGVGQKKTNEGLLLLLSIGDRRSRIEVGYGLEPIIPDGAVGSVLREMRPSLRERNYAQALSDAAHGLGDRIARAKGVSIGVAAPRRATRPDAPGVPWQMLGGVGALVLMLLFFGGGRRGGRPPSVGGGAGDLLTGMLLGGLMGGSGRSRSGGGFGGYDSSDSFGGFGGGDSGGGGASSDW